MKPSAMTVLKILLLLVCAFHLAVGLGVNISDDVPGIVAKYYGATEVEGEQALYLLRPLGACMFALGLLAAVAATNPMRHKTVVYVIAILFMFRGIDRIVCHQEIIDAFGVSGPRNTVHAIALLAVGVTLFVMHLFVEGRAMLGKGKG